MEIITIIVLSLVATFFTLFPIYMIKESIVAANPKKRQAERERLKQLAIERGHVVTANLIKIQTFSDVNDNGFNRLESSGIYEYFYDGKRYKYSFRDDDPELTLTLYFVNDPRKATVAGALKKEPKIPFLIVFIITFLAWFFIFYSNMM